jgi:hypothetical protein
MKGNRFVQGFLIFFSVLCVTFILIYVFMNPMIQDAYKKGYDKGKNETCKIFNSDAWTGDNPTNKEINISLNISFNVSLR